MKASVNDIPKEGLSLHAEYGEEILDGSISCEGPILVDLRIEKTGRNVRVKGANKATFILNCSRCLEEFPWDLTSDFDFLLALPDPGNIAERELASEDMDVSFFDGEYVDIAQIAAEQIFLHLPIKPLCREACKGLCPRCGVNLNVDACRCIPEQGTSPFGALKKIRPKQNQGD